MHTETPQRHGRKDLVLTQQYCGTASHGTGFARNQTCRHPDLRLLSFQDVRKQNSVFYAAQPVVIGYSSPNKLILCSEENESSGSRSLVMKSFTEQYVLYLKNTC